ncbi:MAG: magnesium transporter [Gammaproteobacteria bacterium]|nr:magnesium transporter [Gammaproteobacteria bacterium]MCW8841259.1 magnesium transporter [Gammaproteobacteria bacterium]MCW8958184.1 magnesium transporter [Gammaproteobacteria bacterium]MCW8973233.1 magnesium transporter [Gammaproteobacteria bacterium]MCW8991739.1 magnesium transporter [Gammaproteobacteria bacterium]
MADAAEKDTAHDRLNNLQLALQQDDIAQVRLILHELHPAEIALLLESLPHEQRTIVWDQVDPAFDGDILLYVNDNLRASLIRDMESHELVAAAESLAPDDLADLLPEMPEDVIQQILQNLDEQHRERLEAVLPYPEDTAGGLMNVDTITIRADISLEVVMRYLRFIGTLPETTDSLMVVDREGKYLGLLPLTTLLTENPAASVGKVMNRDIDGIGADTPTQEVATLFEHRDLVTAPVVDESGKLLGRITIDDVVDVIRDKADHDFMGMAGLTEEEDIFAPVITSSRRRAVWLGINLLTALLASWVIGLFEATIQQLVALAVLMPVVASMGGIAGSQTLTLVIRAMALGQVSSSNARRLLNKELTVGLLNGIIWAVVLALVAGFWFNNAALALVIGAAIVINLFIAALSGATIPLMLRKVGADPALAGSVVLTTVTDVIGFFAFLGLAALFLV